MIEAPSGVIVNSTATLRIFTSTAAVVDFLDIVQLVAQIGSLPKGPHECCAVQRATSEQSQTAKQSGSTRSRRALTRVAGHFNLLLLDPRSIFFDGLHSVRDAPPEQDRVACPPPGGSMWSTFGKGCESPRLSQPPTGVPVGERIGDICVQNTHSWRGRSWRACRQ